MTQLPEAKLGMGGFLALLYLCAWCISPPLTVGYFWRILAVLSMGIIVFDDLKNITSIHTKHVFHVLLLAGYIGILIFICGDIFSQRLATFLILLFGFCGIYLNDKKITEQQSICFILIIMLLFIIWNVATLRYLQIDPSVMRRLAKNTIENFVIAKKGVGGYGYIYSLVVSLPIGISCLNKKNNVLLRVFASVFLVTSLFVIHKSGYMIAVLLVFGIFSFYFSHSIKNRKNRLIFILSIFVLFASIVFFKDSLLGFAYDAFDNRAMREKIQDLQMLSESEGSEIEDTSFSTRSERYKRDLVNISMSPLVGWFTYSKTGNHSHFMDFGAQYGLLILFGYLCLLFYPIKKMYKNISPAYYSGIICAIILGIFNTMPFSCAAVIYILFPFRERVLSQI